MITDRAIAAGLALASRKLIKAGCAKVFRDVHVSGAKTHRAQLRRVIEALQPGDMLMVARLDRLARSTRDLFARHVSADH